jgi:hypothetical protein
VNSIRVEQGTATVEWDSYASTRTVPGQLGVHYLTGDLLAATARALDAAGERELADAVANLVR